MKPIFTFVIIICGLSLTTRAQFSGIYAPANWTTTLSGGSNGTVSTVNAPTSITINGSDGAIGIDVDIDYTIQVPFSGSWSFDWSYELFDMDGLPGTDPAFVLINGASFPLSDDGGAINQSDTYNGMLTAGDIIGFRIRATDNCCGNSTLTISNFTPPADPAGPLPVKLIAFTGAIWDKQVKLDWSTAMETKSDRFEIERSANGSKFEKIGTLKSAGNSSQIQKYSFTDGTPLTNANYYRLRQVDEDDKAVYSKTVMVKFINHERVSAYPNPAKDKINLTFDAPGVSQSTVSLYSIQGKLLESRKVSLQPAVKNTVSWDVSKLVSGQYYFKIADSPVALSFVKY